MSDLGFELGFKCADTDLGRKLHFEEVGKVPVNRLSAMDSRMTQLARKIVRVNVGERRKIQNLNEREKSND